MADQERSVRCAAGFIFLPCRLRRRSGANGEAGPKGEGQVARSKKDGTRKKTPQLRALRASMRCGCACDDGIFRRHIRVPTKNAAHPAHRPAGLSAAARRSTGGPNGNGHRALEAEQSNSVRCAHDCRSKKLVCSRCTRCDMASGSSLCIAHICRGHDARRSWGPLRCGAWWRISPKGGRHDVGHRFVGTPMCRRNGPTPCTDLQDRNSGRRNSGVSSFWFRLSWTSKKDEPSRPADGTLCCCSNSRTMSSAMQEALLQSKAGHGNNPHSAR